MKKRIDLLLVEKGLAASREKARAMIMAGDVLVNGVPVRKAGDCFAEDCTISARSQCPFVSRGGLKLQKAMTLFQLSLEGAVCADIGASTGGFTDCMLQSGAKKVYAVDVGYGQLDWALRNDARVVVMERTNARYLEAASFGEPVDFASADVSFISLRHIFPALARVGVGRAVTLIKPQFEAGREYVGKKGVVRDPAVHRDVIQRVVGYAQENGYGAEGLSHSPIKGPSGNIEYICLFAAAAPGMVGESEIGQAVEAAHAELD